MNKALLVFLIFVISPALSFAQQASQAEIIALKTESAAVVPKNFEIGGTVGLLAGAMGVGGELRRPFFFKRGQISSSLRLAAGFYQSRGADQRYVPVQVDLLLNYPPGWLTVTNNYLGAGLNYVTPIAGSAMETLGGEVFYGVESSGFAGKIYGEIGYGILRSGVSPSHKGVTVLIGYRK